MKPPRHRRRAFTLMEMLLTLGLIVLIVGLAWPALNGPFANQRLRYAADRVKARWRQARVDAMDTGRVYIFRYTLDDDEFSVQPLGGLLGPESAADDAAGSSPENDAGTEPFDNPVKTQTLPDGVTFRAGQTELDSRAAMIGTDTDRAQSPMRDTDSTASMVFFYPDGTTSNAVVQLQNDRGRFVELTLRGMTGVVTIGEVALAEDRRP